MAIDATKPVDGVPSVKADLRNNLQAVKDVPAVAFAETAAALAGKANQYLKVNAGETALESVAQAAGGDASTTTFTQAGTGAVASTVQAKLREYDVSVTDFGAVGNGVADDTAAIQLAIDYVATTKSSGHSRILFRGVFSYTPASLDWTAITGTTDLVTMLVDGTLKPQGGPVLINKNMALVGLGGDSGVQFQLGPCCAINAATGQVGLWMQSSGNKSVRNVTVYGSTQPAIRLTGTDSSQEGTLGALYWLENVGVLSGTGVDADCVRIENIFWLWMKNIRLLAQASGGWSLHAYDVSATAISKASGIFYVEDGVIAGNGIRLYNTVAVGTGHTGNMLFRNVVMESAQTPMFTLDTVSPVDWLTIDRCFLADTVVPPATFVEVVNAQPNLIWFRDCGPERKIQGTPPKRLIVDGTPRLFFSSATLHLTADGSYPRRSSIDVNGARDGLDAFRNSEMLPNLLPCQNLGANQDPTTWSPLTFNVTPGQPAPDGSSTAYLLAHTGTGGLQTGRAYSATAPMTDGDYLIAGAWVKSGVATQRMNSNNLGTLAILSNPPLLDGANSGAFGNDERVGYAYAGWVIQVDWWKWTGGNNASLVWDLYIHASGFSYYIWRPFLLRVDGATHTERDVARLAARLSIVDQNAKTGVLTQLSHQTFRTGVGVTGSRPNASAVGEGAQWFDSTLNKPIWSDGTVWRDAAGTDMT